MSYNLFKFPPKNGKNKKQKNLSLLVFFGGHCLKEELLQKKHLKNQTLSKKTKSQGTPKRPSLDLEKNFCKKVLHQLVTTLAYQTNKLRFSCSRSSSILRGALLKKSRTNRAQGRRIKSYESCSTRQRVDSKKQESYERKNLIKKDGSNSRKRLIEKEEFHQTKKPLKKESH